MATAAAPPHFARAASSSAAIAAPPAASRHVLPQDLQDQTLPRQEAEAEPADPAVDPHEDGQQDQVQLQKEALEEDQTGLVRETVFREL